MPLIVGNLISNIRDSLLRISVECGEHQASTRIPAAEFSPCQIRPIGRVAVNRDAIMPDGATATRSQLLVEKIDSRLHCLLSPFASLNVTFLGAMDLDCFPASRDCGLSVLFSCPRGQPPSRPL